MDSKDIQGSGLLNTIREDRPLSVYEKKFLLCAERGDVVTVKRLLETYHKIDKNVKFNINCVDPLGRTALVLAVENENMELIEVLLKYNINPGDTLLHAINEEYVEAVEILLQYEESIHVSGSLYSWEKVDREISTYTRDVTPLILAAHKDNYEILKLLLDRGATLPLPHDVKCNCSECVNSTINDTLRHSRSRINAYQALCSPSLIALSSRDPILTAFQLSWELKRLSSVEKEFAVEYSQLREKVQNFAVSLLDHVRNTNELEIILNYDPNNKNYNVLKVDEPRLERLKLAIDYNQKKFVAHPNVQQLLGSVWYQGLPGFRRRGSAGQLIEVSKIAFLFPIYSLAALFLPFTKYGKMARQPFVKFVNHSASYCVFLSSQRVESTVLNIFGRDNFPDWLQKLHEKQRGNLPNLTELILIIYVFGFIWLETHELWSNGPITYFSDMWNIVDFINNSFYTFWIVFRLISIYQVHSQEKDDLYVSFKPREDWEPYDPQLISEGMFGAANILSFLKMVHIFSVHPHLGPLQIGLGRMVYDILKFFFIYTLVVFAFGCGMNQLLWYYAAKDQDKCINGAKNGYHAIDIDHSCEVWRRFANLFETSQSLFWASFGLIDLYNFDLTGIKEFTRFWGLLMFGSYSVINVVVLLNLLIAMMSNSYQTISEQRDTEWKFARSKLWIHYFDDKGSIPPPFNLIPPIGRCFNSVRHKMKSIFSNSIKRNVNQVEYENVMRCLVRRYVTREQRKAEETGVVTEDDVNEIKQDIASFRYELLDILSNNGMSCGHKCDKDAVHGKKERIRERRLLKGFNIGLVNKEHSIKSMKTGLSMLAGKQFPKSSSLRRNLAKQRWTTAITAVVHESGTQIGTTTPELQSSVSDLREQVLREKEFNLKISEKIKEFHVYNAETENKQRPNVKHASMPDATMPDAATVEKTGTAEDQDSPDSIAQDPPTPVIDDTPASDLKESPTSQIEEPPTAEQDNKGPSNTLTDLSDNWI